MTSSAMMLLWRPICLQKDLGHRAFFNFKDPAQPARWNRDALQDIAHADLTIMECAAKPVICERANPIRNFRMQLEEADALMMLI
jgi:hypothetical protein